MGKTTTIELSSPKTKALIPKLASLWLVKKKLLAKLFSSDSLSSLKTQELTGGENKIWGSKWKIKNLRDWDVNKHKY